MASPILSFPPSPFFHPASFASIFMSQIHRILCILMKYRINKWENTQYFLILLNLSINCFHLHPFFLQKHSFFPSLRMDKISLCTYTIFSLSLPLFTDTCSDFTAVTMNSMAINNQLQVALWYVNPGL